MYSFESPQSNNKMFDILALEGVGLDNDGDELSPWDKHVFLGFGSEVSRLGYMNGPGNLAVEVYEDDLLGDGTVRTPMLEVSPNDYEYVKTVGFAYPGMMAVSDVGDVYQYDGLGGLFKRLKKGLKKIAKKTVGAVRKKVRKIVAKTKIGRALIKIGDKVMHVAMKIVKPLAKVVGKWATRLAPVAALIPGVGPAISGAMLAAGAIGKAITKYGGMIEDVIVVDEKTGKKKKVKKLKISGPNQKKLTDLLKKQAAAYQRKPQSEINSLLAKLKGKNPQTSSRSGRQPSKASIAAAAMLAARAKNETNKELSQKIARAASGSRSKQKQISMLIHQLVKLGYPVA